MFLSLGVLKYVVCLCHRCDGCCVFGLYCDAWSCRCSCIGSMGVSSCICCMFVSCVHPVAVLTVARGDHMEESYSRAGLITALYEAMSVSFCLHHSVVVRAFMI